MLKSRAPGPEFAAVLLRRLNAVAFACLCLLTLPLWLPQSAGGLEFPCIAMVSPLIDAPLWLDWIATAGMAGGAFVALFSPGSKGAARGGLALFAMATVLAVMLDGQRLQAWLIQITAWSLVLALASPPLAMRLLRYWTISVYFYSAVYKFDYAFLHGLGQQMLDAAAHLAKLSSETWRPDTRFAAVLCFPLGELLISGLLLWPRMRKLGVIAAVGLHSALGAILGPWGLDHQPGVIVWNLSFALQTLLLFSAKQRDDEAPTTALKIALATNELAGPSLLPTRASPEGKFAGLGDIAATALTIIGLAVPASYGVGLVDPWSAWALYAPGAAQARVFVHRWAAERLPPRLARYANSTDDEEWVEVRLDRWSLDALHAPLYPSPRQQLGVAVAVARAAHFRGEMRAYLRSKANWLTGVRNDEQLQNVAAMERALEGFRLNARPSAWP